MTIKWHKIFASVQQMHLAAVNIAVTSEFDIISQPPQGDILILTPDEQTGWTEAQRAYLPDGVRDSLAQHHILELKYTEAVNQDVFEQVIGYEYFYRTSRQLSRERVRCFILSSHSTEPTTREAYGYHRQSHVGVYHSDNPLLANIPLLLLNELADAPHNVFFKLFGSRQKAKLSALTGLKRWWAERLSEPLLWLLDGLLKQWFKKGEIMMEEVVTAETLIEEGKELNKLIIQMTPTEMLRELLQDSPFAQQLQAEAEAAGRAKWEAIGGLVEALVIRFQAERELWRNRLQPLSLEQLTELRQIVLTVESLAEFEQRFQTVQPD